MLQFHIDESEIDGAITHLEGQVNVAFTQMRANLEVLLRDAQDKIVGLAKASSSSDPALQNFVVDLTIEDIGDGVIFSLTVPYKSGDVTLARTYHNPYWQAFGKAFKGQPFQEVLQGLGWEIINFPVGRAIDPVFGAAPNTILKITPGQAVIQRILNGV